MRMSAALGLCLLLVAPFALVICILLPWCMSVMREERERDRKEEFARAHDKWMAETAAYIYDMDGVT